MVAVIAIGGLLALTNETGGLFASTMEKVRAATAALPG